MLCRIFWHDRSETRALRVRSVYQLHGMVLIASESGWNLYLIDNHFMALGGIASTLVTNDNFENLCFLPMIWDLIQPHHSIKA